MYLFDTDVLSTLAKRRRPAALLNRLARVPKNAQFTTAVNCAEICFGLFSMEAAPDAREKLLAFFEEQVFPRLTILPFDAECSRVYGRLKASLKRKGRPRFEPDLQIASMALRSGLTLVTGNVRHFAGIPGLRVENWFQEP